MALAVGPRPIALSAESKALPVLSPEQPRHSGSGTLMPVSNAANATVVQQQPGRQRRAARRAWLARHPTAALPVLETRVQVADQRPVVGDELQPAHAQLRQQHS